jgi:hypothetical protein
MAKTSIYLPGDLAEQVRAHGIPVSEVAQAALRQAVKAAEIKENVMTDIRAVAERLRVNRGEVTEADRARAAKARAYGDKWARTTASADDLGYVVVYDDAPEDFSTPISLVAFVSGEHQREHRAGGGIGLPGPSGMPLGPVDRYWPEFQAGAREVWNAVLPLLSEMDEHGATPASGRAGYSEIINPEYRLWLSREPAADDSERHARWAAQEPAEFL